MKKSIFLFAICFCLTGCIPMNGYNNGYYNDSYYNNGYYNDNHSIGYLRNMNNDNDYHVGRPPRPPRSHTHSMPMINSRNAYHYNGHGGGHRHH